MASARPRMAKKLAILDGRPEPSAPEELSCWQPNLRPNLAGTQRGRADVDATCCEDRTRELRGHVVCHIPSATQAHLRSKDGEAFPRFASCPEMPESWQPIDGCAR